MRILQIAPAVGWRLVEVNMSGDPGFRGGLVAETSVLLVVRPIACFALVTDDDDPGFPRVVPVCSDDWPSYLYPIDGKEPGNRIIDQLGPGEDVKQHHVDEARRMIIESRDQRSQLTEENATA